MGLFFSFEKTHFRSCRSEKKCLFAKLHLSEPQTSGTVCFRQRKAEMFFLKKKYAQAVKPNRATSAQCLIATVKRGAWGGGIGMPQDLGTLQTLGPHLAILRRTVCRFECRNRGLKRRACDL